MNEERMKALESHEALPFWASRKMIYPRLAPLAEDLIAAPASQAYVERIFSLCGDLSARKRNRARSGLMQRVFLKRNSECTARVTVMITRGQSVDRVTLKF